MSRDEVLANLRNRSDEIRRRFGVRQLLVFGSAARDELRAGSDVDILVQFTRPATFDGYMDLKFYLEALLGTQVDLITEKGLRKEIRPHVEKDAIRVLEAATFCMRRGALPAGESRFPRGDLGFPKVPDDSLRDAASLVRGFPLTQTKPFDPP